MRRPVEMLAGCAILFPVLLLSQSARIPGKLIISSAQSGAPIVVDGRTTQVSTPRTFAVSPGEHTVVITGDSVRQCGNDHPARVTVGPGATWAVTCAAAGWVVEKQTR